MSTSTIESVLVRTPTEDGTKCVVDLHAALQCRLTEIKTLKETNRKLGQRNETFKGENRVLRDVLATRNTNWAENISLHELASANDNLRQQVRQLTAALDKTKRELANKTVDCTALSDKGNKTRNKYLQAKDEIERLLNENALLSAQKVAALKERDAANLACHIAEGRVIILEETLIKELAPENTTRKHSS